jgi:hypothetical protein
MGDGTTGSADARAGLRALWHDIAKKAYDGRPGPREATRIRNPTAVCRTEGPHLGRHSAASHQMM